MEVMYTGSYAGFSEGGFEMERKVTIIFASGPIIMAWGLGSAYGPQKLHGYIG